MTGQPPWSTSKQVQDSSSLYACSLGVKRFCKCHHQGQQESSVCKASSVQCKQWGKALSCFRLVGIRHGKQQDELQSGLISPLVKAESALYLPFPLETWSKNVFHFLWWFYLLKRLLWGLILYSVVIQSTPLWCNFPLLSRGTSHLDCPS